MYNSKIPCIEILKDDGKKAGFLSAFRDYSFQVSGTWDGQTDIGATPVFGLETFKTIQQTGRSNLNQETTVKYFIGTLAYSAIIKAAEVLGYWSSDDSDKPKVQYVCPSHYEYGTFNCNQEWTKFIDACYERYVLGSSEINGCPYYDPQLKQVVDHIQRINSTSVISQIV